jgi:arginyl-tRNA synthetase
MTELYDLAALAASLEATAAEVAGERLGGVELSVPPRPELGDLSSNAALVGARKARRPPRELAEQIGQTWAGSVGADVCDRFEVAGPGFLNVFLAPSWYRGAVQRMVDLGAAYGSDVLPAGERRRTNIEFVSVNPTGPLHVGHARYASYGDSLCRIFAFAGHDVTREFYVNDFGTQMTKFGLSLAARYAQRLGIDMPVPADGYLGEYVLEVADELIAEVGDRHRAAVEAAAPDAEALPRELVDELRYWGRDRILELFRATLERLRFPFDVWTSESTLYEAAAGGEAAAHRGFAGEVGKALAEMDGESLLFDEEGAVWLRTTRYGDDKDRVLIRQTGEPTYFLSDIAYHRDKMDRGFEHMIDIWGADHHGYVPRMKAAFTALPPHEPERLELIIGQLVNLLESGEQKRMSKRKGDIVTVDDLVDSIGVDAARFFLVGRSHDSTLDLDLDLAAEESSKNPVYYVQYAHARICSILRNLRERIPDALPQPGVPLPQTELEEAEKALVKALSRFPLVVLDATRRRAPHRLHAYLGELAAEFHTFYRVCRVLAEDPAVATFRTGLCLATRQTLATGLGLLGVTAPETM